MRLVKYHPSAHFASIIDEIANKGFSNWINQELTTPFQPSVNIKESDTAFSLELVAPGLQKEDFNIEIKKDQLIIKVEKKEDSENDQAYKRREYRYHAFTKSFHLSNEVNKEEIKATYENGILLITVPKIEQEELVKKIEIG